MTGTTRERRQRKMATSEATPPAAEVSALIDGITTVDLRVRSIEAAIAFYRDLVGLEVAERQGDHAALRADGHVILTLDAAGVEEPADGRSAGLFHTAFLYPNRASLADALARVAERGIGVGSGDHGVSEALYIDDPDGNGVELYRDRPRDAWPASPSGRGVGMYTVPIDLDDLLAERTSRGETPAQAPSGTAVGHVHLQVADLSRTLEFYVTVLGLDLMQMMGNQAAFMSSHGYHHHIGANTWNSRGNPPAASRQAGLTRVAFRVSDPGELARARERLIAAGHEIHDRDGVSVRDPDGIELLFSTQA
jgi:catechol 2,3-dioxygenase